MGKVLILEDEALISMSLHDVLSDHGFQPVVTRSLDAALALAAAERFDAAVVNWRIGDETAERLVDKLEKSATAIVVLSTSGAKALKERLRHPVFDKPNALSDIVAEIKQLLAK